MLTRHIRVRDHWTELTNQIATERAALWRIVVSVPSITFVLALTLRVLPLPAVATPILIQAVYFCFLYAIVVWYVLRYKPGGVKAALTFYVGSLSISIITGLLALGNLEGPFRSAQTSWVAVVGSVLFPLNWLLLRTIAQDHPEEFETVRWMVPASKWHLLYGVIAGCLLAAHFFFTGFLARLFMPTWKSWPFVLWQLSMTLGLRALSEELFYRGLIFNQLYRILRGGFWMASAVAALCNVIPYIAIGWHSDLVLVMITLFYVTAVAMVNAFLCRVSNSVMPGVVCSVIFHVLMVLNGSGV
jgi:hypothetical protein